MVHNTVVCFGFANIETMYAHNDTRSNVNDTFA